MKEHDTGERPNSAGHVKLPDDRLLATSPLDVSDLHAGDLAKLGAKGKGVWWCGLDLRSKWPIRGQCRTIVAN
jgi:hypothetical protein